MLEGDRKVGAVAVAAIFSCEEWFCRYGEADGHTLGHSVVLSTAVNVVLSKVIADDLWMIDTYCSIELA